MIFRFLVAGVLIVSLSACDIIGGANDDAGPEEDIEEIEEAEERSHPLIMTISGDHEGEFRSGLFTICESDDDDDVFELLMLTMGSMEYLLFMTFLDTVLHQGTGTYSMAASGLDHADDEIPINFEIQEVAYSLDSGEVTVASLPSEPGDLFRISFSAQMTNSEQDTVEITGSIHTAVNSESAIANCFGS